MSSDSKGPQFSLGTSGCIHRLSLKVNSMRLKQVRLRNYRCFDDVTVVFDKYTALIGPNGAGKSSILYALDWFFGNREFGDSDVPWGNEGQSVSVEIVIDDLKPALAAELGKFGRRGTLTATRTFNPADSTTSYTAVSTVGPGFAHVLEAGPIAEKRQRYNALRTQHPCLAALTGTFSQGDIQAALDEWEATPSRREALVEEPNSNASRLFVDGGFIAKHVEFVFVPGSADLATQLSGTVRGSRLKSLTDTLSSTARKLTLEKWKEKHATSLADLELETKQAVDRAAERREVAINNSLAQYIPDARVHLRSTSAVVTVDNSSSTVAQISFGDGAPQDVMSQGHGTQRAIMMSMIQSIAESDDANEVGRLLIVALEEPEIYQHPTRSRHFEMVLSKLSAIPGSQVVLATHSSDFVRPERLASVRRVSQTGGRSRVSGTSVDAVGSRMGKPPDHIAHRIEKELPQGVSASLFSHAVVMVEGETDRVVLEGLARKLGSSFESMGVAIVSAGSKQSQRLLFELYSGLGMRPLVVFDGDYQTAESKHGRESEKWQPAHTSHRQATEDCLTWLTSNDWNGCEVYTFGDASAVFERVAIFRDTIEVELEKWPTFVLELGKLGVVPRDKHLHFNRVAIERASMDDLPEILRRLVDQIRVFCRTCRNGSI